SRAGDELRTRQSLSGPGSDRRPSRHHAGDCVLSPLAAGGNGMIQIHGDEHSAEYQAAADLERLIRREWGDFRETHQKVAGIASAQCHGQKVRDIDDLLLVQLLDELRVRIPRAHQLGLPGEVYVKSLCVTLEVKAHPPELVDYTENGDVRVRYPDYWHNASA